jgi:hypothetical protein
LETRKLVDRAKGLLMTQLEDVGARCLPVDPEDRDGPALSMREVADLVIAGLPSS